jgi:hypothetical protein
MRKEDTMTETPAGADISALQRQVAAIIVRDVLQEDFDDLVEGYLDEIMQASLRIIRLPGYTAVARAFETNLADAVIASSAAAFRIEELERALKPFAEAGATLSSRWEDYETHWQGALSYQISAGQLRAARSALSDKG